MIRLSLLFTLKLFAFLFMFLDNPFPGYSANNSSFHENENDKLALLSFKSLITEDPLGVLNSWNDSSSHFCHWTGVRCNSKSLRVTALTLKRHELVGTLSPHVGNLSFLEILDLSENSFKGEIPLGLGNLGRLSMLNMSSNSLGGKIPSDLYNCSQLRHLALFKNSLTGNIPHELGSLSELLTLDLGTNSLYSTIPSSLGNLTRLRMLHLSYNSFYDEVPMTISQLKYLKVLGVTANKLSGEFPPSLYNISSLEHISLTLNKFTGSLRNDIGFSLPNLKILWLGGNSFTGYIPQSFPNASKLKSIDFTLNNFTGGVPLNLGSLRYLVDFDVGFNNLGRREPDDLNFITSLTNCTNLQTLQINMNRFGGILPISIANLSTKLTVLMLHNNSIHGSIPKQVSNLQSLTKLYMYHNYLNGTIPESIGMLQNLTELFLDNNQLTGTITSSIGNITQLMWLYLWNNKLEGEIPSSLANCHSKLVHFHLDFNYLNGTIPRELMSSPSLLFFTLSYNFLTGNVPENVGNMSGLLAIDLSYNKLSGEIPKSIANCLSLNEIFLQGNRFDGSIPDLPLLEYLSNMDLSDNNLSGNIPVFLSSLPILVNLNLSFNNLEGDVPSTGIFSNITAVDVHGNPSLCGGIPELHLPTCHEERPQTSNTKKRRKSLHLILIIVLPASFVALSLLLIVVYLARKKLNVLPRSSSRSFNFYPKISYQDLARATGGFSAESLIGSGSFGTVYRGALTPGGEVVAVKVLNLERKGASKSFLAECEALKNIRHYNLVKVITACSSIDFQGNEFKAIVYQFMSNGNLNSWLHPEEEGENGSKSLNILQRIGIALDVASALEYLHHQCETLIIHCDLKPHNILLDDDMAAHVSDFGLARLIPNLKTTEDGNQFSSLRIKGTIGYAAPEYGMGAPVSILGDVYSFGIVLLEIITGKRPTDSFLQEEDLKLQEYVELALREQDIKVFDDASLCEEVTRDAETWSEGWDYLTEEQIECLISILRIGVNCSTESPKNRMSMSQVHQELLVIRDTLCPKRTNRRP